jgi:hypothetical protein
MARKHNTRHPARGRSTYSRRGKAASADRYGEFKEGRRLTVDQLVKWVQPGEVSN